MIKKLIKATDSRDRSYIELDRKSDISRYIDFNTLENPRNIFKYRKNKLVLHNSLCDTINFSSTKKVRKEKFDYKVKDYLLEDGYKMKNITLREENFQTSAFLTTLSNYKGVIQMPTGVGKSFIMIAVSLNMVKNNLKVLILTPKLKIQNQLIEKFSKCCDLKIGVRESLEDITIYNYRSAVIDIEILRRKFDILIIDECHNVYNDSYIRILRSFRDKRIYGFSASAISLLTLDSIHNMKNLLTEKETFLYNNIGKIIFYKDYKDFNLNSDFIFYQLCIKGYPTDRYENENDYAKLMKYLLESTFTLDSLVKIARLLAFFKQNTLVLVKTKYIANNLANKLIENNINTLVEFGSKEIYYNGEPVEKDEDFLPYLEKSSILIGVNVYEEGIDLPDWIQCVVNAKSGRLESQVIQRLGRLRNGRLFVDIKYYNSGILRYQADQRLLFLKKILNPKELYTNKNLLQFKEILTGL